MKTNERLSAWRSMRHCVFAATLAFANLAIAGEADDDLLTERTDAVFAKWRSADGPGCACGVIRHGVLAYAKGFGTGDLEHGAALMPDSVFYIASTSKQFTAASIALLVLDKKIDLQDDIRKFLPEMPDYGTKITVDHLIHHTSGVRDYLELLDLAGREEGKLDNDIAVRLIARQRAVNFTPGSRELYSNSNYVLLAEIVKRASGQPMAKFAKERIFTPLGMTATLFGNDLSEVVPNRVISYRKAPDGRISQFIKTIEAYGDGNLLTTVRDLARWDQNFYDAKVGGPELISLLRTRGRLNDGKSVDYAFGLMLNEYRGVAMESHGGGFLGFRTEMLRFPEHRTSVIVLCNFAMANPGALARRIADIYLEDVLASPSAQPKQPSFTEIKIKPDIFDAYIGTYATQGDGPRLVLTTSREGSRYFVQAVGQPRMELFPYSRSDFFLKQMDAQISFHRERNGPVQRVTLHQNREIAARRIEPFSPSPTELAPFLGEYYSDEIDASYVFAIDGNALVASDPRGRKVRLSPLTQDTFAGPMGEVTFRRNVSGEVDALSFSGGRVSGLAFERKKVERQ